MTKTLSHHHHHLSLNCEGCWGNTDDFATSFLHFSLFSTALWDLANFRPVHLLMLSSYLFLCLPCLLPPFTVPCKMVLARPVERETWPYHYQWQLQSKEEVNYFRLNTEITVCCTSRHSTTRCQTESLWRKRRALEFSVKPSMVVGSEILTRR